MKKKVLFVLIFFLISLLVMNTNAMGSFLSKSIKTSMEGSMEVLTKTLNKGLTKKIGKGLYKEELKKLKNFLESPSPESIKNIDDHTFIRSIKKTFSSLNIKLGDSQIEALKKIPKKFRGNILKTLRGTTVLVKEFDGKFDTVLKSIKWSGVKIVGIYGEKGAKYLKNISKLSKDMGAESYKYGVSILRKTGEGAEKFYNRFLKNPENVEKLKKAWNNKKVREIIKKIPGLMEKIKKHKKLVIGLGLGLLGVYYIDPSLFHDALGRLTREGTKLLTEAGIDVCASIIRGILEGIRDGFLSLYHKDPLWTIIGAVVFSLVLIGMARKPIASVFYVLSIPFKALLSMSGKHNNKEKKASAKKHIPKRNLRIKNLKEEEKEDTETSLNSDMIYKEEKNKTKRKKNRILIGGGIMKQKIGIWGPRGAGKTCYIAMLMKNSGKNYSVIANNTETKNYVKPLLLQIEKGELPRPTAKTFKALNLTFSMENVSYPLIISDFGGELIEELEEKSPEEIDEITKTLSNNLKEFIKDASGVMLFLEAEKTNEELKPEKKVLRKIEVGTLTTTLKEVSKEKTKVSRPIALVLSKWDRRGDVSKDFEHERKRAIEYLKTSNAYSEIYNEVLVNFENIDIFPITSFGKYVEKDGRSDILPQKPEPLFLEEPIFWIAKRADEVWFESANNFEKKTLKELEFPQEPSQEVLSIIQGEKSIKRIDKIISSFEEVLSYWQQILQDELAFKESKEIAKEHIRTFEYILEQLQQKRKKLKRKNVFIKTGITIIAALIILLVGSFLREEILLNSTLQKINGLPISVENREKLGNILNNYRMTFKPFDSILKGTDKIMDASETWKSKFDELKEEEIQTLLKEMEKSFKKGEYRKIIDLTTEAERKYGLDPRLDSWKSKAEEEIKGIEYKRRIKSLKLEIPTMKVKEALEKVNEILDSNCPEEIKKEAMEEKKKLLIKLKEQKRKADVEILKEILSRIEDYKMAHNYEEAIDKIHEYDTEYTNVSKESVLSENLPMPKKLYRELYTLWDKYLYNKFYNRLATANLDEAGLLEDVYNMAVTYINSHIPEEYAPSRSNYIIYVKKWVEWYRKWQNGGTITISLPYVTISRKIKDTYGWGPPDPEVEGGVSVGDRYKPIPTKYQNDTYTLSLNWEKDFTWRFGETISLYITLKDRNIKIIGSDVIGTINTKIDGFAPKKISNTRLSIFKNGKYVGSVKIMCSGWEPPEIPPYQ